MVVVFGLPLAALLWQLFQPDLEVWHHLSETVLGGYIRQSLSLLLWVTVGSALVGVSSAWLIARHRFSGQRVFQWLLILPMAMPAYIVAYAYTWWLDVAGPVQSTLRTYNNWSFGDYVFPNIRSFGGAVLVLTLVLYPYVYLLARAAFQRQSKQLFEAHQLAGGRHYFRQVALPLARPAIFGGLALVMMETLADYGTVQYFGLNTLTTGILKTWFGLGSLAGAAQIASLLLSLVMVIMLLEKYVRGTAGYAIDKGPQQGPPSITLSGWKNWMASLWCGLVVALGFVLPLCLLLVMAFHSRIYDWWSDFINLIIHTLSVAGLGAVLTVALALLLLFVHRHTRSSRTQFAIRAMGLGYAVPGLVIAVGVTMAFGWLDQGLNGIISTFSAAPPTLLFSGGFLALITAYVIRFLAVAMQPVEAAYQTINKNLDEASLLTGKNTNQTFRFVHLPLLKPSLWTAVLLVFVDLLKELPATLVLRPFNFNTLAVKAYELAADERLADAAVPALCIVAVGLIPVIILNNKINHRL